MSLKRNGTNKHEEAQVSMKMKCANIDKAAKEFKEEQCKKVNTAESEHTCTCKEVNTAEM